MDLDSLKYVHFFLTIIKAIAQGDPDAMYFLADMYREGKGVVTSFGRAVELYTTAANMGHARAQFNLGVLCINGQGMERSRAMAREWWVKAALQDQENALEYLQRIDALEGVATPTMVCCSNCGKAVR